jgi:hypothetical protein
MHRHHHRQQTKEEANNNNNNKSKNARRQRRETLREIKEHAKSALSLNDDRNNNNNNNKEKSSSSAGKKSRWTNSDWRDAFERLFLDDAETFKEVGMQDDLLFYAPSSSRGTGGAKDVVFVRRWKKKEKKNTHVAGGRGGASSSDRNDDNTNNSNNNNSNLEDLTTENVDWRATTLLNIVQHTTYSAEVSVCLLDQLEKKQRESDGGDNTPAKGGEDACKIQREQKGTLANPLASCKTKVFASTSKMAQSNNLKSDRRESTLPEVSFESYYANSEEWEKCALTYDGDCLCVRLFATGGVLRTHLDDDEVATTEAEEEKKIVVFSGFAPRSDVARAYNVERKAAYKQAFTFRAFANSTFGFDLPKLHDGDSNDRRSRRRKHGGSNNSTSGNGVAENGLYDDGYRVNGAHGNSEDYDDDEAEHLDGDVPHDGNRDEDDEDDDGGNHGNSGGEEGGRGTSFLSPYRHHPKSFTSPSRGGAGETDAVVTLGRGTEEEGEAAVAVSAEHLHFSPSSAHKSGTSGGFADDDVSASGGSGINSETDYSSAYDTDDTSSSRRAPPPGTSGKISSSAKTNRRGSGGVRRLLNFGRKVETVREVAESVASSPSSSSPKGGGGGIARGSKDRRETLDVTRLRCRLLGVKIHWRALARDLLYKEWR